MVPNGSKWLQMVSNGSKWFQKVPNGSKWLQSISKCSKGFKCSKWFQTVPNEHHDMHLRPCLIYSLGHWNVSPSPELTHQSYKVTSASVLRSATSCHDPPNPDCLHCLLRLLPPPDVASTMP